MNSTDLSLSLIQEFANFKRSAEPLRFLSFDNGAWVDLAHEVLDLLRKGFVQGKPAFEVAIDGDSFLFDFLRLVRVNSKTGAASSIAWIDVKGQCFFPRIILDRPKLEIGIKIDPAKYSDPSICSNPKKRKSDLDPTPNLLEEHSDETPEASSTINSSSNYKISEGLKWKNVQELDRGARFYRVVEKLFLAGMKRSNSGPITVTKIRKCLQVGPSGSVRVKSFQMRAQMARVLRGDGGNSVKFGWYGAPIRDLTCVLTHGFGRPNSEILGPKAHGFGVHLSPPHAPHPSCELSESDEIGERHIILCRVIMARPERVEVGSTQFHPTDEMFDSGVDDLNNPKWYIVWGTQMNTHILPEYVVSYKPVKQRNGLSKQNADVKRPSMTSLCFSKLISEMQRCLPPPNIHVLQISFTKFKEGKINKETFIRVLRTMAGDKLLANLIKKIRGY